jgi:tetratricopeptide (TPR) repeat protein
MYSSYMERASKFIESGDLQKAIRLLEKAIKDAEKTGKKIQLVETKILMGNTYRKMNMYDNAVSYLYSGLNLAKSLEYERGVAKAQMGLGYVHWRKGDYPMAEEFFKNFLDIAIAMEDDNMQGQAHLALGDLHSDQLHFDVAYEEFEKAVNLLEKTKNWFDLARCLINYGECLLNGEDHVRALKITRNVIKLSEKNRMPDMLGYALVNEALCHLHTQNIKDAEASLEKARSYIDASSTPHDKLVWKRASGVLKGMKGEAGEAEKDLVEALDMASKLNFPYEIAVTLFKIAEFKKRVGRIDEFERYKSQAMDIAGNIDHKPLMEKIKRL